MPTRVILPKVDMSMTSGRIAAWHVEEGQRVEKSAPLFDIETDKAAMEVESPASGMVHHIMVAIGSEVPIGQAVAWIYADGETIDDAPPSDPAAASPARPGSDNRAGQAAADIDDMSSGIRSEKDGQTLRRETALPDARPRATPKARRLAKAAGIDLAGIDGTGPRGRIAARDIEAARMQARRQQEPDARFPDDRTAQGPPTWQAEAGALPLIRNPGRTGPPLVLIHGLAADSTGWARLVERLPADAMTISIDLPCHGKAPLRQVGDFGDLARQLRVALDRIDESRVHLVGHSLGGALALALADIRPRRIASLTLLAPAGLGPEVNANALNGLIAAGRSASLAPWLRHLVADPEMISDSYVRAAMHARRNPVLRQAQLAMADAVFPDSVQAFDLRAALHRVEAPTRIIWGKRDRVIPWKHALQAPGRVSLNLFADCGHMPHLELPEEVATLIGSSP